MTSQPPSTPTADALPAPRRRLRRLRRVLLVALVALALAAATLDLWLPAALGLAAPPLARRFAGLELEVGAVRRAGWGGLALEDVRAVAADEAAPLRELHVRRASVDLSLWRLVRGGLAGIERVRVEEPEVRVELGRGAPAEERAEEAGGALELPTRLPPVELTGGRLDLRLADGRRVAADGLALEVDAEQHVRAAAERVRVVPPEDAGEDGADEPDELARPVLAFDWSAGALAALRLELDGDAWIEDGRVDLSGLGAGALSWQLTLHPPAGAARSEGALGDGRLRAQLALERLDLRALAEAVPLPAALDGLAGVVQGTARLDAPLDDPLGGDARAELTIDAPALGGRGAERLTVQAALDAGALAAPLVEARAGPSHVALRDLAVDLRAVLASEDPAAAFVRGATGSFELALAEPERWLPEPPDSWPRAWLEAALEVDGALDGGALELSRLDLRSPAATARLARGRLDLATPARPRLDVDLELSLADLAVLAAPWREGGWSGSLSGSLRAQGDATAPDVALHLEGAGLVVEGVALGRLALDADAHGPKVELRELSIDAAAGTVTAAGALDLAARTLRDVTVGARLDELATLLPERVSAGALALDAHLDGPLDAPRCAASLDLRGLVVAGLPPLAAHLRLDGDGRELELEPFRLQVERTELTAAAHLSLEPATGAATLTLRELALARDAARLALERPATLVHAGGRTSLDELVLAGDAGRLRATGALADGAQRLELTVERLAPRTLLAGDALGLPLPERVDLELALERAGDDLRATSHGAVTELALPGLAPTAAAEWRVALEQGALSVERLTVDAGDGAHVELDGALPLDPLADQPLADGELDLRARAELADTAGLLAAGGAPVGLTAARAALDLKLAGTWSAVTGGLDLALEGLRVPPGAFRDPDLPQVAREPAPELAPADLTARVALGDTLALQALSLTTADGLDLSAGGGLARALDVRALAADPRAWLGDAPLDLDARLELPDLARFGPYVESLGLPRPPLTAGAATAELSVGGTAAAPEPTGKLSLHGASLRLGGGLPPVDPLDAELALAPEEITLTSLTGELGGGPFRASGSVRRAPAGPELDVSVKGEDLLLFRERGLRVRADAELELDGPLAELRVGGTLKLREGRYTKNFAIDLGRSGRPSSGERGLVPFRFREPPLSDLRFDVAVESASPFEIENTTVTGAVRPELRLTGTGELPVLLGTVYVDPTTVKLPAGSLRVESGTVRFQRDDPFVPTLSLSGGTRMLGYDVSVQVLGRYDAPDVVLSSSPPLPDRELLALVLAGQRPASAGGASSASSAGRTVALYFAKDFLARWLSDESTDSDESLLDRFDLQIGADVTRSGAETVEASFRVDREVLVERDALYLTAERDVYDHYNYGLRVVFHFR